MQMFTALQLQNAHQKLQNAYQKLQNAQQQLTNIEIYVLAIIFTVVIVTVGFIAIDRRVRSRNQPLNSTNYSVEKRVENYIFGAFCFFWLIAIYSLIYKILTNETFLTALNIDLNEGLKDIDFQAILIRIAVSLGFIFITLFILSLVSPTKNMLLLLGITVIFIAIIFDRKFLYTMFLSLYLYYIYLDVVKIASRAILDNLLVTLSIYFLHLMAILLPIFILYPLCIDNIGWTSTKILSFILFTWTATSIFYMCRIKILEASINKPGTSSADNTTFNIFRKSCKMAFFPTLFMLLHHFSLEFFILVIIILCKFFTSISILVKDGIEIIEIARNGVKKADDTEFEEMIAHAQFNMDDIIVSISLFDNLFRFLNTIINLICYMFSTSVNMLEESLSVQFAKYINENINGGSLLLGIDIYSAPSIFTLKGIILLMASLATYYSVYYILQSFYDIIIYKKSVQPSSSNDDEYYN
ncbi:hypothetical protein GINT2_001041 [Glugoides intestinalis]